MRILFLENHDSFSWNVIDALPVERSEITVVSTNPPQAVGHQNQSEGSVGFSSRDLTPGLQAELVEAFPSFQVKEPFDKLRVKLLEGQIGTKGGYSPIRPGDFDCLIIGPGPTDPIRVGLIDIVRQAAALKVPTLGICLGHQAIGLAFGATLIRTHPVHGKRSEVTFRQSRLLPNTTGSHTVMRYHSLSLSNICTPLRVIATTHDSIPMAIEHESLPIAGLQFHPDSYGTQRGRAMLADFFEAIR